ncbi:hypothetical protein I5Q34_25545 [Streptomyces sp. AV19]|uniref:DUF6415 family natural product biosynthesis protein n=1 Tax=Streptomyces sp. AV19 TaxID=2793068 RepID=UPI0018FE594E|nr:DUF6415 family natural product biosynthesis protein [Streptomyces sp. AV19]MBH1937595.1 hypothetical protein [Streptomyces sp. AV19]MDG4536472.1 DUF6415 family natural product biosynthesis protein [Streptomyces sp. AV19]
MIHTGRARRLDRARIRADLREAVSAYVLIPPARETGRLTARLTRHLTALLRMTEGQLAACAAGSVDSVMRRASLDRARKALAERPGQSPEGAADHVLSLHLILVELLGYLPKETS